MTQSTITPTRPRREPKPQDYIDATAESANTYVYAALDGVPGVSQAQRMYVAHEVEMVIRRELAGVYGLDKPRLAVREEDVPLVVIGQGDRRVVKPEQAGDALGLLMWTLGIMAATAFVLAWFCKW